MNSETYKQKFGVSKTRYKNMKKAGLAQGSGVVTEDDIRAYKGILKKAKQAIHKVQKKKHEDSQLHMRLKGKPRKRKDGKLKGSVKIHVKQAKTIQQPTRRK